MTKEELQERLERGMSVEAIAREVGRHASTVSYRMSKYGLAAPLREKHAARGALDRETLASFIDAGKSITQIAEAVGRSKTTVRHWLARYGLETRAATHRRAARAARENGCQAAELVCDRHGATQFVLEGRGCFRCALCRSEAVVRRRRLVKKIRVQEAGARCVICGYDKSLAALHFHHLVPAEKSFAIGMDGVARSLERARGEARKCVPLCSNCHAEVEAGLVEVPAVRPASRICPLRGSSIGRAFGC